MSDASLSQDFSILSEENIEEDSVAIEEELDKNVPLEDLVGEEA
jgi:hypothetical protein